MTRTELELAAQKFLDDTPPKAHGLQREINVAFVEEYGDHPGLATVTEDKERWATAALGNFTAGYVRGMVHHAPYAAKDRWVDGMAGLLKRIWAVR